MVLPGAGGPTQGCGTGAPSTLLVGAWGWLCTHTPARVSLPQDMFPASCAHGHS